MKKQAFSALQTWKDAQLLVLAIVYTEPPQRVTFRQKEKRFALRDAAWIKLVSIAGIATLLPRIHNVFWPYRRESA